MTEPKAPHAKCDECPLKDKGKFVPSKTPISDGGEIIAFVGESPGRTEARKGEPFIGQSGRLLTAVLDKYGIKRDSIMLTNAANCFLPDQTDKSDLPKAIECCRPRLLHELEEHNIKKVVTLGNAAVSSLYSTTTGITKLRGGPPRQSSYDSSIEIIPTFHPAACLRNQSVFPHMVADIGKLRPEGKVLFEKPEIKVIEDVNKAISLLNDMLKARSDWPLVCDTESGKEKDLDIERSTTILCVGLGSMNPKAGNSVVVIGRPAIENHWVQDKLCKVLAKRGVVGQNLKYDIGVLRRINHSNVYIPQVSDTMLQSYSLNENTGIHGLKYMGHEYLAAPQWEDEIKKFLKKPADPPEIRQPALAYVQEALAGTRLRADVQRERPEGIPEAAVTRAATELGVIEHKGKPGEYRAHQIRWTIDPSKEIYLASADADGSFASIPAPILHKYNAYDVQVTRQLNRLFNERIERFPELVKLNKFLMRSSNTLTKIEGRGIKVDIDRNWELDHQYTVELERIGKFAFNPNSPKETIKFFNEELGIPTATTDKDFLFSITGDEDNPPTMQCEPHVVELCTKLQEYRSASRFKSTNVVSIREKALLNEKNIIYPSFLLHTTTTGRTSSRNPNGQNIPRESDIKSQYIPDLPDHVWVQCDYGQNELRILTWLAQDEYMAELFRDPDRDVFDELCLAVYGDRFRDASKTAQKEMRTMVKTMAYGLAYGRGAAAIALAFNMSLREAQTHMRNFYSMVPDIMKFQAEVVKEAYSGRDLITPFGRHRRFHLITNENKIDVANQAKAFKPQSIGSDCLLESANRLVDDVDIRNLIHDALLVQCHKNDAEEVGNYVSKVMCEVAEEVVENYIPYKADWSIGARWSDCK